MDNIQPKSGLLSRISRGRLVLRHAPDCRPLTGQIARNEEHRCDVPDCHRSRWKLGSRCRAHARHYEATGHPTARTIRRGTWRPWVVEAASFVGQQLRLAHPGIDAAVSWAAGELFGSGKAARRSDPRRPHTGYSRALARLRAGGVGPDDFVARWVAAYAFRQLDAEEPRSQRRSFRDDSHFQHQAAKLLLHPQPLGAPAWARQHTEDGSADGTAVGRINFSVRRFAFDRVNAALGLLAFRAADELNKRLGGSRSATGDLRPVARVSHDDAPFLTSNNNSTT
ncbi:MAG: hypothetical protein J0J01_09000 [Reyranella sp.]|uniref:hypothetical protein n=1 Tax=Reyranella sp. TaxID=1929291 RepID=UPI001ACBD947|nr:hypothetical protein [Reyranella sp.]MBN9087031.1 hypothetical protein [Reyranella sp.]